MPVREPLMNPRRVTALCTSLAALAVLTGLGIASARNDDGSKTFFAQNDTPTRTYSEDDVASPRTRASRRTPPPLTIEYRRQARISARPERIARLHQPRAVQARLVVNKQVIASKFEIAPVAGRVTLMTDATLQRGDAVMTSTGIRIFMGSDTFPHRDDDFVALNGIGGLSRSVAKTLLAMDSRPRG